MAATKRQTRAGKKAARRDGGGRASKRAGSLLFLYLLAGGLAVAFPAMAALILLGMTPAWVLLFVDIGKHKRERLHVMAVFNFAGVLPYAAALATNGADLTALSQIIGDIYSWAVMFGAAAAGAGAIWAGPVLAAAVLGVANQDRIRQIDRNRQALAQEWGADFSD